LNVLHDILHDIFHDTLSIIISCVSIKHSSCVFIRHSSCVSTKHSSWLSIRQSSWISIKQSSWVSTKHSRSTHSDISSKYQVNQHHYDQNINSLTCIHADSFMNDINVSSSISSNSHTWILEKRRQFYSMHTSLMHSCSQTQVDYCQRKSSELCDMIWVVRKIQMIRWEWSDRTLHFLKHWALESRSQRVTKRESYHLSSWDSSFKNEKSMIFSLVSKRQLDDIIQTSIKSNIRQDKISLFQLHIFMMLSTQSLSTESSMLSEVKDESKIMSSWKMCIRDLKKKHHQFLKISRSSEKIRDFTLRKKS